LAISEILFRAFDALEVDVIDVEVGTAVASAATVGIAFTSSVEAAEVAARGFLGTSSSSVTADSSSASP